MDVPCLCVCYTLRVYCVYKIKEFSSELVLKIMVLQNISAIKEIGIKKISGL